MAILAVITFFAMLIFLIAAGFAFQWAVFKAIACVSAEPAGGWEYLLATVVGFAHAAVWYMLIQEPVSAVMAALVAFLSSVYMRLSKRERAAAAD